MSCESSTVPVCASQVNTPSGTCGRSLQQFVADKDLRRHISHIFPTLGGIPTRRRLLKIFKLLNISTRHTSPYFNFSRAENSISCTHETCPVIRIICCLRKCLSGSLGAFVTSPISVRIRFQLATLLPAEPANCSRLPRGISRSS